MKTSALRLMQAAVLLPGLIPLGASAHGGHAETTGYFAGLMHSLIHLLGGADHMLALIVVGLLAFLLVRRAA